MKRLLVAVAVAMAGCGGGQPECVRPVDPVTCQVKNTDGLFYRFERNAWSLITWTACECAEWAQ